MITVRKKILEEGEKLEIPSGIDISKLKILNTFRVEYKKDGVPQTAIEVWFLIQT